MSRRFTLYIVVGMLLGGLAGGWAHAGLAPADRVAAAADFALLTDVFLRLIRMIIAPLVLTTLTAGIARMGGGAAVGRVGLRTILWFLAASLVSLAIGLCAASLLRLGVGLHLRDAGTAGGQAAPGGAREFLEHLVPASVVDAMARNEILQIVVFSVFAGLAAGALGERVERLLRLVEEGAVLMLKITTFVMTFAPLAVFGALGSAIATSGFGVLVTYLGFVGGFYLALAVLWAALLLAGRLAVGPRVGVLVRSLRAPLLVAFSTSTSEAAYPQTLERLEAFGIPNRIASFVLPLGYSFNLDGSMMYCTFATLFIAQAYGISFSVQQEVMLVLILMVTSKGIAGVPRASLVVISAALAYFRIPEAGLALVLGVDHFLDMGRAATNVLGNSLAAGAVARFEGELGAGPAPGGILPA